MLCYREHDFAKCCKCAEKKFFVQINSGQGLKQSPNVSQVFFKLQDFPVVYVSEPVSVQDTPPEGAGTLVSFLRRCAPMPRMVVGTSI